MLLGEERICERAMRKEVCLEVICHKKQRSVRNCKFLKLIFVKEAAILGANSRQESAILGAK